MRVGASHKNPTRPWRYKNKTIVLFFMDSSISKQRIPGGGDSAGSRIRPAIGGGREQPMKIDFDAIPVAVTPHMKGGEKEVASRRFQDELGGILKGKLTPGASIGLHIYIVSGHGTMLCDGERETLGPGDCSYCPQGHTHSLMNTGGETLEFFAVLPNRE